MPPPGTWNGVPGAGPPGTWKGVPGAGNDGRALAPPAPGDNLLWPHSGLTPTGRLSTSLSMPLEMRPTRSTGPEMLMSVIS